MVLDAALLNTQHYEERNKGKVEQEMELCPPHNFGVVAIEKGTFESPSTMVANFTYFITIHKHMPTGIDLISKPQTLLNYSLRLLVCVYDIC